MRPSVRLSVGQLVTLLDFHCFGVSGRPRSPNFFQFKSYLACSMSSAHLLSCALCKFISTRRPIHPCHTSTYSTMLLHTSLMCYFWRKKNTYFGIWFGNACIQLWGVWCEWSDLSRHIKPSSGANLKVIKFPSNPTCRANNLTKRRKIFGPKFDKFNKISCISR